MYAATEDLPGSDRPAAAADTCRCLSGMPTKFGLLESEAAEFGRLEPPGTYLKPVVDAGLEAEELGLGPGPGLGVGL
jgi:hypothetical protein